MNQDEPQKSNKPLVDCFHNAKQKATSNQGIQPETSLGRFTLPKTCVQDGSYWKAPIGKGGTGQGQIAGLGAGCSLSRSSQILMWNKNQTALRPRMSLELLDLLPNFQSHLFQRDLRHWSEWVGLKVFLVAQSQSLQESLVLLKSHKVQD